jgi:hypothetical protein
MGGNMNRSMREILKFRIAQKKVGRKGEGERVGRPWSKTSHARRRRKYVGGLGIVDNLRKEGE